MDMWLIGTAAAVVSTAVGLLTFLVHRYKRCPSNKVLVISGKVGDGKAARCISGGGAFVWPVFQEYAFLDLSPISMEIEDLKDALSLENIRVAIPATVTVAIGREPEIQQNAAVRLVGLNTHGITALAKDMIVGQMRQVIASMSIEEINRDRDAFLKRIDSSLEPELKKIGLIPLNVNIRDIKDSSGYIEATGRKAAAQAVNQANADVAEQEKIGKIKVAEAGQIQEIAVAEAKRTEEIGTKTAETAKAVQIADLDREQRVRRAQAEAAAAEGESAATVRKAVAHQTAASAQAVADGAVLVAHNQAQTEAALAKGRLVEAEQRAALEATARAEKAKAVVDAEAVAAQTVLHAEAEARAIFAKKKAEADGDLAIALAKAEGLRSMVAAAGGNPEAAYKLLMVDHIDYVADATARAVGSIKFDKVVVWGGNEGGEVPNFITNLFKTIPPLMDTMAQVGGVGIKVPGVTPKEV